MWQWLLVVFGVGVLLTACSQDGLTEEDIAALVETRVQEELTRLLPLAVAEIKEGPTGPRGERGPRGAPSSSVTDMENRIEDVESQIRELERVRLEDLESGDFVKRGTCYSLRSLR